MRSSRRVAVLRERPLLCRHAWWDMEELVSSRVRDVASGEHMLVVNPSSHWSIIASGISGNRISRSTQGAVDYVFTEARLTDINFKETITAWAFVWPESTDLNSDGYTQPMLGQGAWAAAEAGWNLSVYNTQCSASVQAGRDGNLSSKANAVALGTIGALKLFVFQFNIADGKVGMSLNGAAMSYATTGMTPSQVNNTRCRFNLGFYVRGSLPNPEVSSPANRSLRGKWDNVGYMKGRLLSDADISWLYNAGAGRSYADAVDYGLFRGGNS